MADQSTGATESAVLSHRMAPRILEHEAYRRIMVGDIPETLSEFAVQLSAWLKDAYPAAASVSARSVEETIRKTWHRRHETIGSEL